MAQNQNDPGGKAGLKVELDLDDAPFLDEEEEEQAAAPPPEEEAAAPPVTAPLPATEPAPANKKKKLILAGIGGVVIIIVGVVANVFLFSGKTDAPPPPPPPVADVTETPPPPPPPQEFVMAWEPFWVEMKDTEGASQFLTIKFSVPTKNPIVFAEMNGRKLIIRDALFYYLRKQPILSLSDEAKVTALKDDLLTVINERLGSGKVSEILIEDYLLQ
ncbi:MAG: hypothetical protein DELT_01557 [Desulfovibrio sp.]